MTGRMSRLKALLLWLAEGRPVWLALGVIVVALVVSLRPETPEPVIRYTGLVLQMLGIGTVAWGISETRALFGRPSLTSKTKAWLGRFPLLRRITVVAAGAACASALTCRARAYVTEGPGAKPTLESRVDALERNIDLVHERISNIQKEVDEEFRKASRALKSEEQQRQLEDDAIRDKLEATGTGGVHISAIGAAWLLVGVILSTAAVEIAALLR